MLDIFTMFAEIWQSLLGLLDSLTIDVAGTSISYLSVLIGFIALAFIISFFWKGASQ